MEIDYKNFNEYSEKTKQRLIIFAQFLLSAIEIYKGNKIPLSDFERETFSYSEACSLAENLNEILNGVLLKIEIKTFYSGTNKNNLIPKNYIYIKYKPETNSIINSFLKKVLKNNKPKSEGKKYNFPFTIQSGTTWESVYIEFKNDEAVQIKVSGHTHDTSFADMGFADNRTGKPNMQWLLLKLFARNGGILTVSNPDAKVNYKKHKQLLSDKLKAYFLIDFDPFKPYGKTDGYRIKIYLIPENKQEENEPSIEEEAEEMFKMLSDGEN